MNNSPEHIKKMQDAKAEMYGLVCKIVDDKDVYEIHADPNQLILTTNGSKENKSYYHNIESILDDLLSLKEKKIMIADNRKNLLSVRDAIIESRKWMKEIVRPLFK